MQRGRGKRLLAFLTERNAVKESAFIFEMGCGGGGILKVFQENGFQVQGIDIDAQYVDRGRRELGLNLSTESIENVVWEKTPDIVILSHVLEHLPDPEAELRKLSKRIDDKTLLYVAAPGTKNFFVASKHIRLMHHFEFAHLYYFTLTSLTNLLGKVGFERVYGDETISSLFKKQHKAVTFSDKASDYQATLRYLKCCVRYGETLAGLIDGMRRLRLHRLANLIATRVRPWLHRTFL